MLADIINPSVNSSIGNSTSSQFVGPGPAASRLINALINFGFIAGGLAFVFMFLIGGYQWITSGGDKDAVQKAQKRITNALIGLVVLFSLFALLSLLSQFFGLNLTRFRIPSLTPQVCTLQCTGPFSCDGLSITVCSTSPGCAWANVCN